MADLPVLVNIAVIGAGPAGLMAAERLAGAGALVTVYAHMPSAGRKLLMAGRGGLNLTHSESLDKFITRYGAAASWLAPMIDAFPPNALRDWCEALGQPTFVGSSGRVFPLGLKASPLLRAWLRRLQQIGVRFAMRHQWRGWDKEGELLFANADGSEIRISADATILALGGASWPRLGSDGGWAAFLREQGIRLLPFRPANCGFIAGWSSFFIERCAGQPLKPVIASFADQRVQGEAMITREGIEGGVIYALSAGLRDEIERQGRATLNLDLRPGLTVEQLAVRLQAPRGRQSTSTYLRKIAGLSPAAIGLIRESLKGKALPDEAEALAALVKNVPLVLTSANSITRAISSAGGISRDELDTNLMLHKKPGVFVAGEMIDWEAPTGGYLLQASFSTAVAAAGGVRNYLVF